MYLASSTYLFTHGRLLSACTNGSKTTVYVRAADLRVQAKQIFYSFHLYPPLNLILVLQRK